MLFLSLFFLLISSDSDAVAPANPANPVPDAAPDDYPDALHVPGAAPDDYPDADPDHQQWNDDHNPPDDYDSSGGDYDRDYYERHYHRPTRDPKASYIPCPNPRAYRDDWDYCVCLSDYPYGSPDDQNGCWRCDQTCHLHATCVSPGRCQCLDNHEGDGVTRCDPIVPQLVALSPTTGYTDIGTWIHISFLYTAKNWEWQKNSAVCKFGSYVVPAVNVTDSTLECRAPPHHPATVQIAISIDGTGWSKETFVFVYQTQFNVFSILPIVGLYATVILAIAMVIWKLVGGGTGRGEVEEQEAFLIRRKKEKGAGVARKMKQGMGP
jgi:hypothetical protein